MNTFDYQSNAQQIETCGRFVCLTLLLWKNIIKGEMTFNFNTLYQEMVKLKQKYGVQDFDQLASSIISK
jgi:hypothetical protein